MKRNASKHDERDGRSRHRPTNQPTNQSFRVYKVNLATLNVATKPFADCAVTHGDKEDTLRKDINKTWEQQAREMQLAAREARAVRRKSGHRSGIHRKANKLNRHQKSTETHQAATPTWLAGTFREWVAATWLPLAARESVGTAGWSRMRESPCIRCCCLNANRRQKDVNPCHGREGCQSTAQLIQHPEFDVRDPLDGGGVVGYCGIVRLPSNRWRREGCSGTVAAVTDATWCTSRRQRPRQGGRQVHSRQNHCWTKLNMRQIKDLKCKFTGVR